MFCVRARYAVRGERSDSVRSPCIGSLVVLWILTWGASAWADGYGDIEVKGPRRVRISLDNVYKGMTTKAAGGLTLIRVRAGVHVLRATMAGMQPQEARVTVKAGETLTHKLRPFLLPGEKPNPDAPGRRASR